MREMMTISADQVSPQLRALFDDGQPLAIRCFAVLDGSIRGQIWTDDLAQPTWGAVQEWAFDTLFFGGQPDAELVHKLIKELQLGGGVELGLWPDHPYNQLLPPDPDVDEWELEFTDCLTSTASDSDMTIPEGCELLPIDRTWFERMRYRDHVVDYFGSAERALEHGFGFCLAKGEELLAEAFAAESALGMIELGTITAEPYQRRGYALLCCAQLVRECEARGYRTYWNCSKDNPASANLARKLGHQTEKVFRFVAWDAPEL
ncbi:MAG: GNAT family N-acetyltransferase [Chloroflexota bacterium]